MPTISVTEARSNLYKLLEEVNESSSPLLITNKNGKNCYLIGEEDFNAILETMYLNSVEGLADLIISEGKTPYSEAVSSDDLDWQFMAFRTLLTKQAVKDLDKLKHAGLSQKAKQIVDSLKVNPYCLPYEKLVGNLKGFYSKRINIQHRIVYKVDEEEKVVLVVSMWSHYGD